MPLASGGTGASDAAAARSNLGLAIGVNVQPQSAQLNTIAVLPASVNNIIVGNGSTWTVAAGLPARQVLGVAYGVAASDLKPSATAASVGTIYNTARIDHIHPRDSVAAITSGTIAGINSLDVSSEKIRIRTSKTPSSQNDTGNTGEICWDANYIYICHATNFWKRAALSSW